MKRIIAYGLISILCICTNKAQSIYNETDTISISLNDISIHSVISKPANKINPPIALIIAGSGPTDLNGNQANMKSNCLRFLSENLLACGIATCRFDKRAIGKSKYPKMKEENLTIDIYAEDVVNIIKYLQNRKFSKIFIIGHSEGSLIGLIALQAINVSGFVSLAGAGNSADSIFKKQLKPKMLPFYYKSSVQIINKLKMGSLPDTVPSQLAMMFRKSVLPYMISWFKYEPTKLISKLKIPTLIVQGTKDLQIDDEEFKLLTNANKSAKSVKIKNMNHVLKTIKGDNQENIMSYFNPNLEVNESLVNEIASFINGCKTDN